jgi:hypothetical protein
MDLSRFRQLLARNPALFRGIGFYETGFFLLCFMPV